MRLDHLLDLILGREHRLHVQAGQQPNFVEGIQIEGIARRHIERAVPS